MAQPAAATPLPVPTDIRKRSLQRVLTPADLRALLPASEKDSATLDTEWFERLEAAIKQPGDLETAHEVLQGLREVTTLNSTWLLKIARDVLVHGNPYEVTWGGGPDYCCAPARPFLSADDLLLFQGKYKKVKLTKDVSAAELLHAIEQARKAKEIRANVDHASKARVGAMIFLFHGILNYWECWQVAGHLIPEATKCWFERVRRPAPDRYGTRLSFRWEIHKPE